MYLLFSSVDICMSGVFLSCDEFVVVGISGCC